MIQEVSERCQTVSIARPFRLPPTTTTSINNSTFFPNFFNYSGLVKIENNNNIHLLLIFFSFVLIVHHVLCHFQRLFGFDSIKRIEKTKKTIKQYNPKNVDRADQVSFKPHS